MSWIVFCLEQNTGKVSGSKKEQQEGHCQHVSNATGYKKSALERQNLSKKK